MLCAFKATQPYQHCDRIERESGNDESPNSLKAQLEAALGAYPAAKLLVSLVQAGKVDAQQINMPSFVQFKRCLVHRLRPREGTGCEIVGAYSE